MNQALFSLILLSPLALWTGLPQGQLQPTDSSILQPGAQTNAAANQVEALRGDLRGVDLSVRMDAYGRAVELVTRYRGARDAVESWAGDSTELELAWTAQLILREAQAVRERASRSPFGRSFPSPLHDLDFGGDLFEQLEQLLERRGGLSLDAWPPSHDLSFPGGQLPPGSTSQSQGFSMSVTPDGVRIELKESEGDHEETKVYEAESVEQLLELHPELEQYIDAQGAIPPRSLHGPRMRGGQPLDPTHQGTPRTDRLGVRVLPPGEFTRDVQGLGRGVGLEVVSVLPGSLAEALEISRGDVLIAIDGHSLRSVEDVKHSLGQRAEEASLEVEVIDRNGQVHLRTWAPAVSEERRTLPLLPLPAEREEP